MHHPTTKHAELRSGAVHNTTSAAAGAAPQPDLSAAYRAERVRRAAFVAGAGAALALLPPRARTRRGLAAMWLQALHAWADRHGSLSEPPPRPRLPWGDRRP
jgi:hypothetical protein